MKMPATRPARTGASYALSPAIGVFAAGLVALSAPAYAQSGEFSVDPLAADQAIERALVQTGSALLAPRQFEVVPFFAFQNNETQIAGFPALVDGELVGTSVDIRQNEMSGGVILRAGLPWTSQIEMAIPVAYAWRDQELRVLGATYDRASDSLSGLGDIRLTYTKQLRADTGGLPSLLGSVTWDTDTGQQDDLLALGSGFNEVGITLTATQSQDPLVFSGRIGYQRAFEKDNVQPGDQVSFDAGAFLAVNPETSVQFGLSMAYTDDFQIDNTTVAGSDQLSASLNLGLATILRRNTLLDTVLSIGISDDAPDFAIAVSMPISFSF